MKRTFLYIGGIILLSSLAVSCVSKKKYEELARAKREADRNILELRNDKNQLEVNLKTAKEDFNNIRYQLTENNASKDKTIDQLYNKLRSLESKQVELKSELTNAADQIKTNTLSSNEQIASLEKSLQRITVERDNIRQELSEVQTNLEFENRKLKSELEVTAGKLHGKDAEIEKAKKDLDALNKKLNWIRKTKATADAEIKKLTNQVNLLKKELSK